MKHPRVKVKELTRTLAKAAGEKSPSEIAKVTGVHISRVGRFLTGDFTKLTPVLRQFCKRLGVACEPFLLEAPASGLSPEILDSLRRIVGRDPGRTAAARRLVRSLEVLTRARR